MTTIDPDVVDTHLAQGLRERAAGCTTELCRRERQG